MTGTDPERLQRRRRWAAEQLGLSPQATPDEVRAAWLRRLPEEDFVPSSETRWALTGLLPRPQEGGWEARADEAAAAMEEERLRTEVAEFAAHFWNLSPDERRRRWDRLRDRCAFAPPLRARLRLLEPGLAVDPSLPDGEDNRVRGLARQVSRLFVLPPAARAHARQSLLRRLQNAREWKAAARLLRGKYPSLAALGNDLLDKLLTETPRMVHLDYADNSIRPKRQVAKANAGGSKSGWSIWMLVFLGATILRLVSFAVKDPSTALSPEVRFPTHLLHPPTSKKEPDALDRFFEKQNIRDEKVKESLRNHLESRLKKWDTKKKGVTLDKTDDPKP